MPNYITVLVITLFTFILATWWLRIARKQIDENYKKTMAELDEQHRLELEDIERRKREALKNIEKEFDNNTKHEIIRG